METNEPYPLEVTNAINAFVDRIEQVLLQGGTPRSERTSVCAEVETQIHMMIERKIESGAELNLDLVNGIIESMDPPESYTRSDEPAASLESHVRSAPSSPDVKSPEKRPMFDHVRKFLNRPARTTPVLDWVAIVGLASTCLGLLLAFVGIVERSEFATVSGLFWIFAGVIASGISFWRIRHSAALLTGQRIASVGVLALPIAISNAILCALLFATPVGRVLGAIVMVGALVYANYRVIQYALRWLASYSAEASQPVVDINEPIRKPEPEAGQMTGGIATS